MSIFTGSAVAIITPFTATGEVDYEGLYRVIDFQIENGTDAVVICGTTGEGSTLTMEEHVDVIKACCEHVNGRVPVIAGTGSNCTKTAIELTNDADAAGADAALIVTPYYNKATQRGLVAHYNQISANTKLPIIMYSVKSRTGVNIDPATAAEIINGDNHIVGIKEASGDIAQCADIMDLTDGKAELYSGNDDMIVPILSLGGRGVISVLSHVAPKETHEIVAKFFEGDVAESRRLQLKYMKLCHALFCEVNPIPVKKACELMGLCGGTLRPPLYELTPEHTELLRKEMQAVGIL